MPHAFAQAEQFLLSLANLPRKEYMENPKRNPKYLGRVEHFLRLLGNPEKKIPHIIHIAGTSGKGSTANFLRTIFTEAGCKTGMLESPHYSHICERWSINGKRMSEKKFVGIVERLLPALDLSMESSYETVSYTELDTIIGLLYFAEEKVEWAILETGCGGRYDSTNVIPKKDAAVITSIGLDHTKLLGDTKSEIAYEKAGIIKNARFAFSAVESPKLAPIFEKEAKKNKIPLIRVQTKQYTAEKESLEGTSFVFHGIEVRLQTLGLHQIKNAVLAAEVAQKMGAQEKEIVRGLEKTIQRGRMEVVQKSPWVIIDSAHNEDKMRATVEALKKAAPRESRVHLLIGTSRDKNLNAMVKGLSTLPLASVAATRNTMNPFRKVSHPKETLALFKKHAKKGTPMQAFLEPHAALGWTLSRPMKKEDIVLITGSVFLAGELRPSFIKN